MPKIFDAFQEFDNSLSQKVREYSGILGLPTTNKTVSVPNRNGYVYVRLRDNESEIIQAYNEEVSPVWNLPVIVVRQGTGWRIKGRDVERYNDWGSSSSFMPAHHYQHEFNRAQPGGDIVFVYSDQFVPLLVTPSGTAGAANVLIQPYTFRKSDGVFVVVGNTGTQSFLPYKPTDNQGRMALVYLDRDSGNHGVLINSGTSFAGTLTGTSAILPYLPTIPTSSYEPLYGVRLVSGTQTIQWDNLYDLRQFYGGSSSGTGGGSTSPGGSDQDIQFNQAGSFGGEYDFHYDYSNNVLILGSGTPPAYDNYGMHIMRDQGSPYFVMWAWQSNSSISPYIAGYKARGTRAVPQAIEQFDDVFKIRARGYNGTNYTATQAQLLFTAPYDWASGSHPLYASIWGTPSGSATMQEFAEFNPNGINLDAGKTYNISGSPHTHSPTQSVQALTGSGTFSGLSNYQYFFDISGLTGDKHFSFPSGNDGDSVNVHITSGSSSYSLILEPNGSEWSRLFIQKESAKFVKSSSGWILDADGRIKCYGVAERQAAQSIPSQTSPNTKILLDTTITNVGDIVDTTTDNRINIRRDGNYKVVGHTTIENMVDTKRLVTNISVDGTVINFLVMAASASFSLFACQMILSKALTNGQYVELEINQNIGTSQNTSSSYPPFLIVEEVF